MRKNAEQDGVYRRQVDHRYVSQVAVGVPRAWTAEGRLLRLPGRAVTPLAYVIAQVYAKETYRSPETMELIVGSFGVERLPALF